MAPLHNNIGYLAGHDGGAGLVGVVDGFVSFPWQIQQAVLLLVGTEAE